MPVLDFAEFYPTGAMAQTIWKFPLQRVDTEVIQVPKGAVPLSAQIQRNELVLWMMVDPEEEWFADVPIWVCGTGGPVVPACKSQYHLDTVQHGPLVIHVFVGEEL